MTIFDLGNKFESTLAVVDVRRDCPSGVTSRHPIWSMQLGGVSELHTKDECSGQQILW